MIIRLFLIFINYCFSLIATHMAFIWYVMLSSVYLCICLLLLILKVCGYCFCFIWMSMSIREWVMRMIFFGMFWDYLWFMLAAQYANCLKSPPFRCHPWNLNMWGYGWWLRGGVLCLGQHRYGSSRKGPRRRKTIRKITRPWGTNRWQAVYSKTYTTSRFSFSFFPSLVLGPNFCL